VRLPFHHIRGSSVPVRLAFQNISDSLVPVRLTFQNISDSLVPVRLAFENISDSLVPVRLTFQICMSILQRMLTEFPPEQHDIGDFYVLKLIVEGRDVHSTNITAD
jgi:hypothetical protein